MLLFEARFEVFKVMKIQVAIFWVVTPCSDVVGYPIWYHNPEDLDMNLHRCENLKSFNNN